MSFISMMKAISWMQIYVHQFAENVAIYLSLHYTAVAILICGQYYRKQGKFLCPYGYWHGLCKGAWLFEDEVWTDGVMQYWIRQS